MGARGGRGLLGRRRGGAGGSDRLDEAALQGFTFAGAWQDLDGDGAPDLYVVNDFGEQAHANRYLANDGAGGFTDASDGSGLELAIEAMGIGIGDLNADGAPDMAISNVGRLHVLMSGEGGWFDAGASMGLDFSIETEGRESAWGTELADLDNDGDLDLIATFGPTERELDGGDGLAQPDGLWLQRDGGFEQAAADWGADQASTGRGLALADLNGDGWLDVVKRDYKGGAPIMLLSRCGDQSWLRLGLRMQGGNRYAIGARVDLELGEVRMTRWIHAGSTSVASSGPPEAHFGLGLAESIDALTITWPDGTSTRIEDLTPRQLVTVYRGGRW